MSGNPFAAPAPPGEGIKWADLNGHLLLIKPLSVETGIQTSYGETDAVRADVVVLDGNEPGVEHLDTLVFPKVLRGQLGRQVGQMVLGRLGQGQGKPGQSPPWMLAEATAEDVELGERYLASRQPEVSQPAPAQAQPAAAPAPAPAQQGGASVPF